MPRRITLLDLSLNQQKTLATRYSKFEALGIVKLFDRMLDLHTEFFEEVEVQSKASQYTGAKRINGSLIPIWKHRLWMHMIGSSLCQFISATSHILWGQASEAYGHVRHAIENSGIAYLSSSEPKIAGLYRDKNEKEMSKHFPTAKLFPMGNSLTSDLNGMFRQASKHIHGNLHSNQTKLAEEDFSDDGEIVESTFTFMLHGDTNSESIWEACFFVLTAVYYVMRLYEATFDLAHGQWHTQLEEFKAELDRMDSTLRREFNQHLPS